MRKTHPVVMLSTEKSKLCLNKQINHLVWSNTDYNLGDTFPNQHLYIISDDEIKEGDWIYWSGIGDQPKIAQAKGNCDFYNKSEYYHKIVAATDQSLIVSSEATTSPNPIKLLPQIPISFIKAYIKAYNEGKPITEVDLEMTQILPSNLPEDTKGRTISFKMMKQIKTRLDNTVIVHQSKMYSRDEVKNLIIKVHTDLASHSNTLFYEKWASKLSFYEMRDKWIEENL